MTTTAQTYWLRRMHTALRGAELTEDTPLFGYTFRRTAIERLMLIGLRAADEVKVYRACETAAFTAGLPALVVDEAGRWAALCSVSVNERLATVDAVATWEAVQI